MYVCTLNIQIVKHNGGNDAELLGIQIFEQKFEFEIGSRFLAWHILVSQF